MQSIFQRKYYSESLPWSSEDGFGSNGWRLQDHDRWWVELCLGPQVKSSSPQWQHWTRAMKASFNSSTLLTLTSFNCSFLARSCSPIAILRYHRSKARSTSPRSLCDCSRVWHIGNWPMFTKALGKATFDTHLTAIGFHLIFSKGGSWSSAHKLKKSRSNLLHASALCSAFSIHNS